MQSLPHHLIRSLWLVVRGKGGKVAATALPLNACQAALNVTSYPRSENTPLDKPFNPLRTREMSPKHNAADPFSRNQRSYPTSIV
jgi:hypothetical protein